MLMELFSRDEKIQKFDFFYLPIDPKVLLFKFRTTATWGTRFWTFYTQNSSGISTWSSMVKSGRSLTPKRSSKSALREFRALHSWPAISSTQKWSKRTKRCVQLDLTKRIMRTFPIWSRNKKQKFDFCIFSVFPIHSKVRYWLYERLLIDQRYLGYLAPTL